MKLTLEESETDRCGSPSVSRAPLVVALVAVALLAAALGVGHSAATGLVVVGTAVASILVAARCQRRHREQKRMAGLLVGQTHVLEAIATGAPLGEILTRLSTMIERQTPGLLCSILLLDGDRLRHAAAPTLPESYNRVIDGLQIGPDVGSCGTAAWSRQPVVVTDIATDPLWKAFRPLALAHGLRACWSAPIIGTDGGCLGTFAMYYREPRRPRAADWRRIETATHLARVAIERQHTEAALAGSRARLEEESRVSGALVRVGREMMSSLNTPAILERLCRLTVELLECDCSDTVLHDAREDVYLVPTGAGYEAETSESLRELRMPAPMLADLLAALDREQLVQVRSRSVQDPFCAKLLDEYGIATALYVALRRGDEIVGFLSAAYQRRDQVFTPLQQRIALGIGQIASMALENARLIEKLRTANQLKSEFVSTMSHELRTPLNVIIGYSEILHERVGGADAADALGKIRGASLELLEMIEATLNLNRLEAGKDAPQLESVSLRALCAELAAEFAAMRRSDTTVLRWDGVDDVEVWSDRRKLKIVLKNLVGNAVKFTPAGEVEVSCRGDGTRCAIAVRDTGIGIAPDHLPVIFEMFRQADSSDARSYSGVGLGLYIVRRLLEQIDGEITVDSRPGAGSTFTVRLPVAAAPRAQASA